MSDTLDPKDLTAEERALVDMLVAERMLKRGDWTILKCYNEVLKYEGRAAVLARRKFYGEPQGAKAEMPCPNCKEPIKVSTEHILFMHEIPYPRYTCQPAPSPAPVAGELAEAVEEAALALRLAVNPCDGSPSDERLLSAADALEAWARSLSATSGAQFPKVLEALTTFRTMNHHHHQGSTLRGCNSSMIDAAIAELDAAQAVPIGMTPELEQVLTAARHFIRPTFGLPESSSEKRLRAAIAAVRAQAKQPQAVPVEAIRALLNGITSREQRDAVRRYLAAVEGGK